MNTAEIAIGILASVAIGLGGFSLSQLYTIHADIELLKQQNITDQRIERTLRIHWTLHRWAHDELNILRNQQGLPPARWPDIGERP